MLTKVYVTYLANPEKSTVMDVTIPKSDTRYLIKTISGLGPVTAEISQSPFALGPGVSVNSSRIPARNIVMTVEYRPDHSVYVEEPEVSKPPMSVEELRRYLYSVLPTGEEVLLDFEFDDASTEFTRSIRGYVETHEPSIFSKDSTVEISILCHDPYFQGDSVRETALFSEELFIYNHGDVPIGVSVDTAAVPSSGSPLDLWQEFTIEAQSLLPLLMRDDMFLKITGPMGGSFNGSYFELSTVPRDRHMIRIDPDGTATDRFQALDVSSKWGSILPGVNKIVFKARYGPTWAPSGWVSDYDGEYTVNYTPLYGGL